MFVNPKQNVGKLLLKEGMFVADFGVVGWFDGNSECSSQCSRGV
jgi:hypothetical protein